jgi:dienelactone hydrolase
MQYQPSARGRAAMSYKVESRSWQLYLRFGTALLIVIVLSMTRLASADWESFKSAPIDSSKSETLRGLISKSTGTGPFPAVILAHGCFGVEQNQFDWAQRLNAWGYVTLILDSFGPRDVQNVCSDPKTVSPETRACDVFGAAAYLRKQSYVNPQKIGLIGFSHGGWTALYAAQESFAAKVQQDPLQAVVAYYPWCPRFGLKETKTPLLVLIGKEDDWTPLEKCVKLLDGQDKAFKNQVKLIAFDDAFHGFDDSGVKSPKEYDGHKIEFNSQAAAKSIDDTNTFLKSFLNP